MLDQRNTFEYFSQGDPNIHTEPGQYKSFSPKLFQEDTTYISNKERA